MRDLVKAQLVGNGIVWAGLGVLLGTLNALGLRAVHIQGLPSTGAGGFLAGLVGATLCFVLSTPLACLALTVGLRVRRGRQASESPARQAAV